jgi:RTX calcium-binding nonapeptide repeat (4 copies)
MQISVPRPGRRLVLAACVASLAASPTASAEPVTAELRVEAGKAVVPGNSYVTDTTRIRTDPRAGCNGSGATKTVQGPSALGIVESAARVAPSVRPFSVSDEFDFGLLVCGIGGSFAAADGSSYWLYKVDHKFAQVGGEQYPLTGGEQVLWYFVDSNRGLNTGSELELVAPARARPGAGFTVRAIEYDEEAHPSPAAGVLVFGAGGPQQTGPDGRAQIVSNDTGRLRLRAVRGNDIPAEPVSVCVNSRLSRCPALRGERIFGTNRADRIRGTRGADAIRARGGRDRINVRGGGRDRVRCGRGRDVVRLGRGDRAAGDCERVRR